MEMATAFFVNFFIFILFVLGTKAGTTIRDFPVRFSRVLGCCMEAHNATDVFRIYSCVTLFKVIEFSSLCDKSYFQHTILDSSTVGMSTNIKSLDSRLIHHAV